MRLLLLLVIVTTAAATIGLVAAVNSYNNDNNLAYGQLEGAIRGPRPPLTEEEKSQAVSTLINATISNRSLSNPEVQTLAAQDPQFKAFTDIWQNCVTNLGYGNGTISQSQCMATFDQATGKWCGLEEYHPEKCKHATDMVSGYGLVQGVLSTVGLGIFEER